MLNENKNLIIIGVISYLYNILIYRYIIDLLGEFIYNYLMINILILYIYDNFKTRIGGGDNEIIHINDNYMSIIMNQLTYIIKQNDDIKRLCNKDIRKYKGHNSFINNSFMDIYEINKDINEYKK